MCRSAGNGRRKYVYPVLRKEGEVPVDRAGSPCENDHRESCAGNEYLDRELFYTRREAQVLIERWRQHDNTVLPHRALGYRPPAPAARAFPTLAPPPPPPPGPTPTEKLLGQIRDPLKGQRR